jgi:hypothetical protein
MPDEIKRIDYYYASVPDKPGEGARILAALRDAGVNLIGVSAFPHGAPVAIGPYPGRQCHVPDCGKSRRPQVEQEEERVSHPG